MTLFDTTRINVYDTKVGKLLFGSEVEISRHLWRISDKLVWKPLNPAKQANYCKYIFNSKIYYIARSHEIILDPLIFVVNCSSILDSSGISDYFVNVLTTILSWSTVLKEKNYNILFKDMFKDTNLVKTENSYVITVPPALSEYFEATPELCLKETLEVETSEEGRKIGSGVGFVKYTGTFDSFSIKEEDIDYSHFKKRSSEFVFTRPLHDSIHVNVNDPKHNDSIKITSSLWSPFISQYKYNCNFSKINDDDFQLPIQVEYKTNNDHTLRVKCCLKEELESEEFKTSILNLHLYVFLDKTLKQIPKIALYPDNLTHTIQYKSSDHLIIWKIFNLNHESDLSLSISVEEESKIKSVVASYLVVGKVLSGLKIRKFEVLKQNDMKTVCNNNRTISYSTKVTEYLKF